MKQPPSFKLQFAQQTDDATRRKILAFAREYPVEEDSEALRAGKSLRSGEDIKNNLKVVVYDWKLQAYKRFNLQRHLEENTEEELRDAIHLAVDAKTARAAIAVLVGLAGIGIPVASAIMTVMFPERFTVVDTRAVMSL